MRLYHRTKSSAGMGRMMYEPVRESDRYKVIPQRRKTLGIILTTPFLLTEDDLNGKPDSRFGVTIDLIAERSLRGERGDVHMVETHLFEAAEPDDEERANMKLEPNQCVSRVLIEVSVCLYVAEGIRFRAVVRDLKIDGYYVAETSPTFAITLFGRQ